MHRIRDIERWEVRHNYESAGDFLSSKPKSGVSSVKIGDRYLDLMIKNRRSPNTLIVFHSALIRKVTTLPAFSGHQISSNIGANLISVADPALELGDLDLAWFLGDRTTGPLSDVLVPLIQHTLRSFASKRTILFGASGGGHAAVNFAQHFPGSIVLALNPRLDLSRRPIAKLDAYYRVAHGDMTARERAKVSKRFVPPAMSRRYGNGLPFHLCIFQNTGDTVYLQHQLQPFQEALAGDPRLHVRQEYTAEGHRIVPKATVHAMLKALTRDRPIVEAIRAAGFTSPDPTAGAKARRFSYRVIRRVRRDFRALSIRDVKKSDHLRRGSVVGLDSIQHSVLDNPRQTSIHTQTTSSKG